MEKEKSFKSATIPNPGNSETLHKIFLFKNSLFCNNRANGCLE